MTTRPLIIAATDATDLALSDLADRSVRLMHCDADGRRYAAPFRWRPRAVTAA